MNTTSDLINNIKIRGSFPTANDLFSNSDYLSILSDEMINQVTPILTKINQEYFLTYLDIQTSANKSEYRFPRRAIGSILRNVQVIDSGNNITELPRLFEEDNYSTVQGNSGYYIKGNVIILSPTPTNSSSTLRLAYFRRPSKFVLPTACAKIQSIDTLNNQMVVTSLPSTMSNGVLVDFVQGDSPYDILQTDMAIVNASGTTLQFTSISEDLLINDYVCLAGESCVPMVPEELVPFLVQAALCVCLSSKKDKSVELELQKLEQMKETIINLLSPRVKSSDVKIQAVNGLLGGWN